MPKTSAELYVGIMSGTSMDGVDAVLIDFSEPHPRLCCHAFVGMPASLREQLLALCRPLNHDLAALCEADSRVAELCAQAVLALLEKAAVEPGSIRAIGSHGQTIRHLPHSGHTLQIGDPNRVAELTGITTVADFRRRDMAAGGQGAPLVPAFHKELFEHPHHNRVIANIGGISNLTLLPGNGEVSGFDAGPGNLLLDSWCHRHCGRLYDHNGQWGAAGQVCGPLLERLLADPFFELAPPKSTGREYFHLQWLQQTIDQLEQPPATAQSVQSTLVELTACGIAQAVRDYAPDCHQLYLCGGGAFNCDLVARIKHKLDPVEVLTTAELGLDPQHVEASAFAWLARQTLNGLPGNVPAVTNASGFRVLGGVYHA